jgi:hypothetical protein
MNLFKVKPAKTDFDESMLPSNRKEVFFDVCKLHWKSLALLGIILLLFCVPFLFIEVFEFFAVINIQDKEDVVMNSVLISNISNLIKIPFFFLLAIILSGVIRIIRQFCWIENVTLSYDFFLGLKQNIRQVIILMMIVSLFWYLSIYCLNISYVSENFMKYVLVFPFGLFVFVIMPIVGYMLVAIATYSNTLLQNIKVAFIVYASNPFKAILCTLLCSVIFAMKFIPNIYIQIISEAIGYIILPFLLLGFFLYSNKQFDKYINKHYYPELVNKGLHLK